MLRLAILGVTTVLAAQGAAAAPAAPPAASQVLADRFAPFDQAAEDGWEAATPTPLLLYAAVDKPAGAPLSLQPGSYRIVVLCDCNMMEVTVLRPDSTSVPSERSDDHGAMYSLDVPLAGAYLTGIDMDDCAQARCPVGVKVYRKKKT
ncbi:MAG TPA: hypothetical protein VIJ94_01340 [Caulobacteraceae bacterium]